MRQDIIVGSKNIKQQEKMLCWQIQQYRGNENKNPWKSQLVKTDIKIKTRITYSSKTLNSNSKIFSKRKMLKEFSS